MADDKGVYQRKDTGKWVGRLPPSVHKQLGGRGSEQFDTKPEAVEWRRVQMARATLGQGRQTTGILQDYVAVFHEAHPSSPTTYDGRAYIINRFIKDKPFGLMDISNILPMHLDQLLYSTPENNTRTKVADLLTVFFRWAYDNEMVRSNPYPKCQGDAMRRKVQRLTAENRKESVDETWSFDELCLFISSERNPLIRDFWIACACLAVRRGEGIGLTWPNIHFNRTYAKLVDNVSETNVRVVNTGSPKSGISRKAYFGPYLAQVLADRRADQDAYQAACGVWRGDWVFDRRRTRAPEPFTPGAHLKPNTMTRHFNRTSQKLGLPFLSGPHGLRRTFATLARKKGFGESVIAVGLGHALSLTMKYAKPDEVELRELAMWMDAQLEAGLS